MFRILRDFVHSSLVTYKFDLKYLLQLFNEIFYQRPDLEDVFLVV